MDREIKIKNRTHKDCKIRKDLIPLYYFYGNKGVSEDQFKLKQINSKTTN